VVAALNEARMAAKNSATELGDFDPKTYNAETKRFAQTLSWVSIRTVYYRQAAKVFGAEYLSHPIRNFFNLKCILFDNHPLTRNTKLHSAVLRPEPPKDAAEQQRLISVNLRRHNYFRDLNQFCRNFWQDCNTADSNLFGVATYDLDLLPSLAYVIHRARFNSGSVLDAALELRESRDCAALRTRLKKVYEAATEDDEARELREWANELRDLKRRLQSHLGYERERISASAKIVSYQMTVPRCLTRPLYPFRPHLAFIRDVIVELASVGSLGAHIDRLWQMKLTTTAGKRK
jgi:hypothetical protein